MLVTPIWQDLAFLLASRCASWDLFDVLDPQRLKLAGGDGRTILIWETTTKKLTIYWVRGVIENRDSVRHATMYQVRRFQCPCAINVYGYDNDVSRRFYGRLFNDKQSSNRS